MTREISRQAFVHGALDVAAGALLGSLPDKLTLQARKPRPRCLARKTGAPSMLRSKAESFLPASAEYAAAKNLFNARFDTSTPAAVVAVKSINDVQKAVAFAAKNSIQNRCP